MAKQQSGITLIELMIVLVIIAILSTIVYPSYTRYIQRARRTDAQSALLDLAARMETFFTQNNTYAGATIGTNPATDVLASAQSPEGWYVITLNTTATTYTLTATPQNAQTADTLCGALTYNNLGVKGESGTGTVEQCW